MDRVVPQPRQRRSGGGGDVASVQKDMTRMPVGEQKDYCRFCLIKFEHRFLVPLFTGRTQRLEHQIRNVLLTIEMSQADKFSNFICVECATKMTSAFNFMDFCYANQKVLRSPHFNEQLLVHAVDFPADPPIPADLSYLDRETLVDTPPADEQELSLTSSKSATPTALDNSPSSNRSPPPPVTNTEDQPVMMDADDDENCLSSMVECQLDEEEAPPAQVVNELIPNVGNGAGLPPANPYRCSVCYRPFGKKANVLSHFQTQHTNLEVPGAWKYEIEPAKCPLCGDLVECLFAHLEYHAGRRTFKCPSCEWAFYSKNYLTIHMAKLHKADALLDARPDRFVCKLCPQGKPPCRDYDDLVAHYRQWHLNEMKNKLETCQLCGRETRYMKVHLQKHHSKDNAAFKCHLCDKSYAQSRYLQSHYTTAHRDQLPSQSVSMSQPPLNGSPLDFSMQSSSQGHVQQQLQQQPKRSPPSKVSQEKRRASYSGDPVQCVKCQMQFPNNRMLNMHIQRYHSTPAVTSQQQPPILTTAEVSVTAVPANGPVSMLPLNGAHNQQDGGRQPRKKQGAKRRRDSVAVAGPPPQQQLPPKDMWNNSLTGMFVNMFGPQSYES